MLPSAGDPLPANYELIEVHVSELKQLFNAIDPSPFRERDLDLLIGGWVAMWRPMEIFLYDWWPIRADAMLADRLSVMPVRISYKKDGSAEAWRWDWPAVPPAARALRSEPLEIPNGDLA